MKMRNKKLLAVMITSTLMTCPVLGNETVTTRDVTLTGYESAEELAAIERGERPATTTQTAVSAETSETTTSP